MHLCVNEKKDKMKKKKSLTESFLTKKEVMCLRD